MCLLVQMTMCYVDNHDEEFIKPAKCPHHNLKEVEVFGYGGRPNEDQLIIYFIENAVSLEKIIVNPYGLARGHAIQHLKNNVPSTVAIIF